MVKRKENNLQVFKNKPVGCLWSFSANRVPMIAWW